MGMRVAMLHARSPTREYEGSCSTRRVRSKIFEMRSCRLFPTPAREKRCADNQVFSPFHFLPYSFLLSVEGSVENSSHSRGGEAGDGRRGEGGSGTFVKFSGPMRRPLWFAACSTTQKSRSTSTVHITKWFSELKYSVATLTLYYIYDSSAKSPELPS